MSCLVDTNVLLRLVEGATPFHEQARAAVKSLRLAGEELVIMPQNVIEFWNVATRPQQASGFGLTPVEADREVHMIESLFPLRPDTPAIYEEWRRLVVEVGVSGVQVHDARLAAAMRVHAIGSVLTFNGRDFRRFGEIGVLHPADVTARPDA